MKQEMPIPRCFLFFMKNMQNMSIKDNVIHTIIFYIKE